VIPRGYLSLLEQMRENIKVYFYIAVECSSRKLRLHEQYPLSLDCFAPLQSSWQQLRFPRKQSPRLFTLVSLKKKAHPLRRALFLLVIPRGVSSITWTVQRLDILIHYVLKLPQTAFRFPRKPAPSRFARGITGIFKRKTP
jgi:hypothetical protein